MNNLDIVRCKECIYYDENIKFCTRYFGDSEPSDFCLKGELENDERKTESDYRGHKESKRQAQEEEFVF